MEDVPLYNSSICRLCAEENDYGNILFSSTENSSNLCDLINTYLPLKVYDDGKLPRTICPGCSIQLEATVEFFKLIINGQKVLRELVQQDLDPSTIDVEGQSDGVIYELTLEDGVYSLQHPTSLLMAGFDKPKRKRGRPPKKPKTEEELQLEAKKKEEALVEEQKRLVELQCKEEENAELFGKRRRKTPQRFKEAVQGKELERIFREEGVIDGEESDQEQKVDPEVVKDLVPEEVIGHLETPDGKPSGELVVFTRGKGRGRPRGRVRSNKQACGICGLEFSCVGRYMSHIAQHGPVMYQCGTCEGTFTTRLHFNQHQDEEKHEGQTIIQCDDKIAIKTELNQGPNELPSLESAMDNIENSAANETPKLNNSTKCNTTPSIKHETSPNENDLSCHDNVETLNTSDFLNSITSDHKIVANNMQSMKNEDSDVIVTVERDTLDLGTEERKENASNAQEVVSPEVDTNKKKLKCPHCDKLFSSKQSKSMHIKATHSGERPYVCKECGAAFPYPRSLSLHAITHKKRVTGAHGYACDLCGKVLSHPSSVVYHKEAEHAGQRFVCLKCGKSFKHRQLLQRHQLVHSQARPYVCKTCNATFKTKANLLNHQLLHSGIKKFSCEICKQSFAHKTSLTLHMRWHSGSKPYSCNVCGKSFTQKGNLSEHVRIHTGEKPYQCSECSKCFTTSSQYRLHARRHTGERPYACAHCGKRFLSRESWRGHIRREQGTREHRCTACGRAFCERWALLKHMRCHTGERPFKCPYCPRAFADPSNLNKHKKQIHKQQISLLITDKENQKNLQHQQSQTFQKVPPQDSPALVVEGEADVEGEERVIYVTYSMEEGNTEPAFQILDPEQAATLDDSKVLTTCDLYEGESLLVGNEEIELATRMESIPESDGEQETVEDMTEDRIYLEDEEAASYMMDQQLSVTDEDGNPIHLTMADGTQLAITCADGESLQVRTRDGQSIPVELSGYKHMQNGEIVQGATLSFESQVASEEAMVEDDESGGHTVRMLSFDDPALAQYFTIV